MESAEYAPNKFDRRLRGMNLDNASPKWALLGSQSPFAVLLVMMIFDTTGRHGCFR